MRDLGGLIVIDFIDMGPQKAQREVENRLREAVKQDRARVQIGKISRFGLLEMSRQRLRPSLGESSYLTCPRCSGIGTIRSVESLALAILRIIGEEARKERTAKVIAQLPVEVATYLLNEKRDWVQNLESRHDTLVILVANSSLETPHYRIRRVRDDQVEFPENTGSSYALTEIDEEPLVPESLQEQKPAEMPAVTTVVPATPAPIRKVVEKEKGPGLFARLFGLFGSSDEGEDKKPKKAHKSVKKSHKTADDRGNHRGGKRRADSDRDAGKDGGRKKGERKKGGQKKRGKKGDKPDAPKDKAVQADSAEDKSTRRDKDAGKRDSTRDTQGQAASEENRTDGRKTKKRRSRGGRRRRARAPRTRKRATMANSSRTLPGRIQPKPRTGRRRCTKPAASAAEWQTAESRCTNGP
ncbi:MAG: ribonuclease E/G [Woeseiaceae bacterium]|nr:ribonuclease E/G [Woeseiaceae bacterium]